MHVLFPFFALSINVYREDVVPHVLLKSFSILLHVPHKFVVESPDFFLESDL